MASSRPSAAGLSLTESSLLSLLAQASDLRTYQVHSDAIIELHALVIGKERSSEAKPATGSPPPSLLEPLAAACSTGLKHLHKLLRFLPEVSFDLPQSAGSAAYTPLPAAVGSGVSSDELELIADVSRPLQCLCGCLAAEVGRFCSDSRISQKLPELVATSGLLEELGRACLLCAAATQQALQSPPSPHTSSHFRAVSGLAALACSVAELWISLAAGWPRHRLLLGEPMVHQMLNDFLPVKPPPYPLPPTVVPAASLAMALLRSSKSSNGGSEDTDNPVPVSEAHSRAAAATPVFEASAAATPAEQQPAVRIAALIANAASTEVAEFLSSNAEIDAAMARSAMQALMVSLLTPAGATTPAIPPGFLNSCAQLAKLRRTEKAGTVLFILEQRAVAELLLYNLAYRAAQVHTALQGVSPISMPARYHPPDSSDNSSSSPVTVPPHHLELLKALLGGPQAATGAAAASQPAAATSPPPPAAAALAPTPVPAPGTIGSTDADAAGPALLMRVLPAAAAAVQAVETILQLQLPGKHQQRSQQDSAESSNMNLSPELCTSLMLVVLELAAMLPESSFVQTCLDVGRRVKSMLAAVLLQSPSFEACRTAVTAAAKAVAPALLQLLGPAVLFSAGLQEEQWAADLRQAVEAGRSADAQHGTSSDEQIVQHSLCIIAELLAGVMMYRNDGPAAEWTPTAAAVLLHSFKQQPILFCETLEAAIRAVATSSSSATDSNSSRLMSIVRDSLSSGFVSTVQFTSSTAGSTSSGHNRPAISTNQVALLAQDILEAAYHNLGNARAWLPSLQEVDAAGLAAVPTVLNLERLAASVTSLLLTCLKVYDSSSSLSASSFGLARNRGIVVMALGLALQMSGLAGAAAGNPTQVPLYQLPVEQLRVSIDVMYPLLFVGARGLLVGGKHLGVIMQSGEASAAASHAASGALDAYAHVLLDDRILGRMATWQQKVLGDATLVEGLTGEQHLRLKASLAHALVAFKADRDRHVDPDMCKNVPADLPQRLAAFGEAWCAQLPVASCCNNPHCNSLERRSERALVSSGGCRCSGCKVARYHCRECQRAQWKLHKHICTKLFQAAAREQ